MKENEIMSKWTNNVYEHLSRYKALHLKKPYQVEFRNKLYGHILRVDDSECNYLGDEARDESKKIKKHMYWYHLNSSQTMCINYFAPFIKSGRLSTLFKEVFGINAEIDDWEFEHTPKENSTNFDFWARDKKGNNYYFEIKYTEGDVNKTTSASDPSVAFKDFYMDDYESNKLFKGHISFDEFMYEHYQAYRNMVKAKDGDYSIFITMDGNSGVTNELNKALKDLGLTRDNCRNHHILVLSWQKITEQTLVFVKQLNDIKLINYYTDFKEKYIDLEK